MNTELTSSIDHPENIFELCPEQSIEALNKSRSQAVKKNASLETQRAWKSDWKVWLGFCNSGCLDFEQYQFLDPNHPLRCALPADPRLIKDFIVYFSPPLMDKKGRSIIDEESPRSFKSYSVATLNRILSTIAKAHQLKAYELPSDQLQGFIPNPIKDPLVTATLSAHSRYRTKQKQARPIQWKEVSAFLSIDIPSEAKLPNTPEYTHAKEDLPKELKTEAHWLRARALLTVAYNSMARREELVAILKEHIEFDNDGNSASLYLPIIKGGKDDHRYLSAYAITELREWLNVSGIETGHVFCKFQRSGTACLRSKKRGEYLNYGKAMSGAEVNKIFKACMTTIGKGDDIVKDISGHSCRVGAAIDLQEYGASGPQIQDAGGWSSPTMPNRYTRAAKTHTNAMASLSKQQQN